MAKRKPVKNVNSHAGWFSQLSPLEQIVCDGAFETWCHAERADVDVDILGFKDEARDAFRACFSLIWRANGRRVPAVENLALAAKQLTNGE